MKEASKQTTNQSTQIWAMRHGPTTWNVKHIIQGNVQTDIIENLINNHLEKLEIAQVPQPDVIIVSALKRTSQTADAVRKYRKWPEIPVMQSAQLNERKWGIFEGVAIADAEKRFKEDMQFRKLFPGSVDLNSGGFKVQGGESIEEVANGHVHVYNQSQGSIKDRKY